MNTVKIPQLIILIAGISVMGTTHGSFGDIISNIGTKLAASAQWSGRTALDIIQIGAAKPERAESLIKRGIKVGAELMIVETLKDTYKQIVLKEYIIEPIQKYLKLDKSKKLKTKLGFMDNLAKRLQILKDTGADKKQIKELSQKITAEYNVLLDKLIGKKSDK